MNELTQFNVECDYYKEDSYSYLESCNKEDADYVTMELHDKVIKRIEELEKELFIQENEANKAVLRACNMLAEKDERIEELENKLRAMQVQTADFISSLETTLFKFKHYTNRINNKGGES